jgi:predicted AlkP superfamily pyrophosphatase or phosphodiesterase
VVDFEPVGDELVLPDYGGACVSNVIPALLAPRPDGRPAWIPAAAAEARQVVVLVLDGLGWEQLDDRWDLAPTLRRLRGGPITTVAPSTTATALTSITTGLTPGEHGVIGYRIEIHGEVLNVLRWATTAGDARKRIPPTQLQPIPPFLGHNVPVVTRAEFAGSGFTLAHLSGVRQIGIRMPSSLVVEVRRLLAAGEPFVYTYYEGIDKVAHEYGLGEHYDAELVAADQLVADLLGVLPPGAALVVASDHGQVDCGDRLIPPDPDVLALTEMQSGEGRFRWLHARPGRAADLLAAATAAHGDVAWVVSAEQVVDEDWFGPRLSPAAAARIGDVALVARAPLAFDDPADSGPFRLVSRHGSLTAAEVLVPLLAGGPG